MIYPNTFEDKIGFTTIRELLKKQCISDMGKGEVDNITHHTDETTILDLLAESDEFRSVLLYEDPFPAQDYFNLSAILKKIAIPGTFIEIEELAELRSVIQTIIQIIIYFKIRNEEEKFPHLWNICKDIILEKKLNESINLILDHKGNFRDDASDELIKIKSQIRKISGEADRKIKKMLVFAKKEGISKEDAEITIRNGRLCIPVLAAYKRRLQGFVHDESATGQTVFIEPTDVFDANNELRNLLNAEKREIIRILTLITDEIRESLSNLQIGQHFLGTIDFIRAKAKLALLINGVKPNILAQPHIHWRNAIHPLLFLNFKEVGKKVEPLHISLVEKSKILIISGPNAGGKSVCLKTVGLLQYMMQCGLLVSMDSTSDMGIFSDFFIDIGDEQSIDNDLSTYSSHLTNLNVMLQHLKPTSLFLIDEFGSGTEPALGGALAEAILETIYHKKSVGIITTHYGNLKMFPDTYPEAINGAMLYDPQAMKPLFKLKLGKPGSSFTYEIARLIGLPKEIIDSAIAKTGTAQIDYERKLEEIENEKIETENRLKLVHAADEQLASLIEHYQCKFNELEKQRKEILQKSKNQAIAIIENANKVIEKTVREIKESQANSDKTKALRKEIAEVKKELHQEIPSIEKEQRIQSLIPKKIKTTASIPISSLQEKKATPLQIGDMVYIPMIQTSGEVKEIEGEKIVISFNAISYRTTKDKVEKLTKKEAKNISRPSVMKWDERSLSDTLNAKVTHFNNTLDVRGKRAEEARKELELYLDEAILLGVHEVRILHGKGNGILRRVIRDALSTIRAVRSFADEQLEWGGDGITVVHL